VRAIERLTGGSGAVHDAKTRLEDLERRIANLNVGGALLERELAINDLRGRVASVREGAADIERQAGKLQVATGLARRALDEVRPDLDLDQAEELLLSRRRRAKVDHALQAHAKLSALHQEAEKAAEEADERASELKARFERLDAPPDTVGLQAAIGAAHADGHIEERLREAYGESADARQARDAALRDLEPVAEVGVLRAMRPPNAQLIERFVGEFDQVAAHGRTLVERREQLDVARRQLEEDQSRLSLGTDAPTVEDLGAARNERDANWTRLRRRLEGDQTEHASPDEFESQLRHSDELSDRLRDEADVVARRGELAILGRRLDSDYENLEAQVVALAKEREDCERRWLLAWHSTGIEARTPREMSGWLRDRRTVLECEDTLARRVRMVAILEQARDQHRDALRAELTAVGSNAAADTTLLQLLATAQEQVTAAETTRGDRVDVGRELRDARATAARQRKKASEYHDALESWGDEWAQLVRVNHWPADVDADNARQVLAAVDELGQQLREIEQLGARVAGIAHRIAEFEGDAARIVEELAPELASWPASDAVAELARRTEEAVRRRNRREALEGEVDTAQDELRAAERAVEEAQRDLQTLMAMAGVATIDELPQIEQRATRAAALHIQLPELERRITEAGQAPLRDLIERAEGTDLDTLSAQVAEADDELTGLEEQLAEVDVRLGELGRDRRAMETAQGAAGAAQLVQQHLAELRALVQRYLRLYLAAWALSEAIEAYRRDHKDPLLRRADELFPMLTRGAFERLEVGFDNADEPVLIGVRASGDRVPVKFMSTGTREQLYLALRLASLERHVALHGPMPVILDDVVLHSDPKRTSAILGALADLGCHTQVIVFSHDPQVVALAQDAIDPKLLVAHELGGTEIVGAHHPHIAPADVRPIRPAAAA
jgi:hypothetical protein